MAEKGFIEIQLPAQLQKILRDFETAFQDKEWDSRYDEARERVYKKVLSKMAAQMRKEAKKKGLGKGYFEPKLRSGRRSKLVHRFPKFASTSWRIREKDPAAHNLGDAEVMTLRNRPAFFRLNPKNQMLSRSLGALTPGLKGVWVLKSGTNYRQWTLLTNRTNTGRPSVNGKRFFEPARITSKDDLKKKFFRLSHSYTPKAYTAFEKELGKEFNEYMDKRFSKKMGF